MKYILRIAGIPNKFEGQKIKRNEPCRLCSSYEAIKIGETDYWDLKSSYLVRCSDCNHIQLDPMLTESDTETGCLAYHLRELTTISEKEQARNLVRNFRRGVLFAHQLKKWGFYPKDILEFGPGSGYFAAGIQFIFPDSKVFVADIVTDVLEKNKEIHNFTGIKGLPENFNSELKFDLIIARDILEHINDVGKAVKNISNHLKEGGLFHFLTPNGYEDVWKHYISNKINKKPTELLINHVNYFDGKSLKAFLQQNNLKPFKYFAFQFKTTRRGAGWSFKEKLRAKPSEKMSAKKLINELELKAKEIRFEKAEILNEWYISNKYKFLTVIYSFFKHNILLKVNPEYNVGHEIFGVFIKGK